MSHRPTRLLLPVAIVALAITSDLLAQFEPPAVVPDGTDADGGPFLPPGEFPLTVSGANISISLPPSAEIDESNRDNLRVEITATGPYAWTDCRHNLGDLALNIGVADPTDPDAFPPAEHVRWEPSSGKTTYAWGVQRRLGIALATVAVNGFDNGNTVGGGTPLGVLYGTAYFNTGFRSGVGYGMYTGAHETGNGSQDLQMGIVGQDDLGILGEGGFDLSVAYFPFSEGWIGASVSDVRGPSNEGVYIECSASPNLSGAEVRWNDDDPLAGPFVGLASVVLPGYSPEDGMLFVAPSSSDNNANTASAFPTTIDTDGLLREGWVVTIREDGDLFDDGAFLAAADDSEFSFLFIPWDSERLIGGHFDGFDEILLRSEGEGVEVETAGEGVYEIRIPGKTPDDGALLLSNSGPFEPGDTLGSRAFLSYEYDADRELWIVEAHEAVEGDDNPLFDLGYPARDTAFYFVFVDFDEPLAPPSRNKLEPVARVPDSTDIEGGPFLAPATGSFPARVSGATVTVEPRPGSVLDGDGSNDLRVRFLGTGPTPWTDCRHNEGDIALSIGPALPEDPSSYPPDDYLEWAADSGKTTYAWGINHRLGVALATVAANGVDHGDTFDGEPVGTVYGVAYFNTGFRSGVGYGMYTGAHETGNGAQDLQLGLAGLPSEGSVQFSAAFFPYSEGWIGGCISDLTGPAGEGVYLECSRSAQLGGAEFTWIDDDPLAGFNAGLGRLVLPAYTPDDGMLFVAPSSSDNNANTASAFPVAFDDVGVPREGWTVSIREDNDLSDDGSLLATRDDAEFCFLFVPWDAERLVGGYFDGFDSVLVRSEGDGVDVGHPAEGVYEVTIPGATPATGALLLSNAGAIEPGETLGSRGILSYEYDAERELFVVESHEVVIGDDNEAFGESYPPVDTAFYFVWVDFTDPLSPPGPRIVDDEPPAGDAFVRGDTDASGTIELTDAVVLLTYLFAGGAPPACADAADADDNGALEITDGIRTLNWLFTGGAPPAAPAPEGTTYTPDRCAVDPTDDDPLGCEAVAETCAPAAG